MAKPPPSPTPSRPSSAAGTTRTSPQRVTYGSGLASTRASLEDTDAEEARALLSPTSDPSSPNLSSSSTKAAAHLARLTRGFYTYSIASEAWVIATGTLFLPVVLEQFARDNGYVGPAYTRRCKPSVLSPPGEGEGQEGVRCAVQLLGRWVDTASFSLFVYSASVFLQAVVVISLGSMADDARMRHRLLTIFAFLGSSLTIGFILVPSDSPIWMVCILLAIGANVSFGASMVCLNSYLPELGRTPLVLSLHSTLTTARSTLTTLRSLPRSDPSFSSDKLLSSSQSVIRASDAYHSARGLATSAVSSRGVAMGYASGILALLLLLIPVTLGGGSTTSLRWAVAGSGVWWAVGTVPALIWLRPQADPLRDLRRTREGRKSVGKGIAEGWRGLFRMLREWRRLPPTFVFLAAWFLLSDAFSTLTSTAMLFAKTSLSLPTSSLILIAALTPSAGIAGAISFPYLQRNVLHCSNLRMLGGLVGLALLVPSYGLVGLRSEGEMYGVAVVFGAIYGSFQSYARTCFSELVPSSQAARWFGLYSITDKSSSFLGPMLVAVVTNLTGQIRHGFLLILLMLLLALPVLGAVDMHEGRDRAERYVREEEENLVESEEDEV